MRKETAGGAWCPKKQIENGVREWLQIDLKRTYIVTGIETQGRFDHGRGQEYVEEYTLEYRRTTFGDWKPYKKWDGKEVKIEVSKENTKNHFQYNQLPQEKKILFI